MATANTREPTVVQGHLGGAQQLFVDVALQNKSGETFVRGAVLQLSSQELVEVPDANLVNVGANDDRIDISDIVAGNSTRLYGIALKDAPATGQILIPVAVFTPNTLVEGNLHAGANGASPGAHVSVVANLMSEVGMVKDDNGFYYFTVDASEKIGRVVKLPLGTAGDSTTASLGGVGDSNIRVHVQVYTNVMSLGGVAA